MWKQINDYLLKAYTTLCQRRKKQGYAQSLSASLPLLIFTTCLFLNAEAAEADMAVLEAVITYSGSPEPAPCTVSISDSEGKLITETEAFKKGFRCNGVFKKEVTAGPVSILVTRGFETAAFRTNITLRAGETTRLGIDLKRLVDMSKLGWFASDSHAHMIHGERTIKSDFEFVALSAQAEDLQFFSLSHAWNLDNPTPEKLSAIQSDLSTESTTLSWNIEAPKNYYRGDAGRCLGHCWFIGMQGRTSDGKSIIPLLLQSSAADYESRKPVYANFESHEFIHENGGSVYYTHPLRWWTGAWGGRGGYPRKENMRISNMAVELPLDTLIGPTYDGLDLLTSSGELKANGKSFELWSLLLNHGYRVAATASSDSCFDRPGGATPGSARTYTFLQEPFSPAALSRATAAGRTFATTGPIIIASVDNSPPGTSFSANGSSHSMKIEILASGKDSLGLKRVEIIRNGEIYKTEEFATPQSRWQSDLVVKERSTAWFCVRAVSASAEGGQAISGAFFFDTGKYEAPAAVECQCMVNVVDAADNTPVQATITEIHGVVSGNIIQGKRHELKKGKGTVKTQGTVRLRAEAPGYQSVTLSPVLDSPSMVDLVTGLQDTDLLDWKTFEKTRSLLQNLELTFKLQRIQIP